MCSRKRVLVQLSMRKWRCVCSWSAHGDGTDCWGVCASTLPATAMMEWTTLRGRASLSNMRQVLGSSFVASSDKTPPAAIQYWKYNITSDYFHPYHFHPMALTPFFAHLSFFHFLFLMCLTLCLERKKKQDINTNPGAHIAVETWTLRRAVKRQQLLKEERREVPLSSGSGRGGVSHPVERYNAKWLFLPIPLWGSTEVECLSGLVRCTEILLGLLSGKNTQSFISLLEARQSFQDWVKSQKTHCAIIH